MRHADRTIRSISQMIRALKAQADPKDLIWFRGQSNKKWPLVPSLARKSGNLQAEVAHIKRFMQNAVPHMVRTFSEEWEWMFLMQHHRAPTRLLDWSESALTALYFAVHANPKAEGAVWCLDPLALNAEAKLKFNFESEIPAFGIDHVLDSYLPSHVGQNPTTLNPIAIMGPRNTPRMAAQLGTFTINHRDHSPIEKIGAGDHVWRWVIPPDAKPVFAEELAYLAISSLTQFPELDRVAEVSAEVLR